MLECLAPELERIAARLAGHEAKPREACTGPLAALQRAFDLSPFEMDVIAIGAGLATNAAFAGAHAPFSLGRALEVLEGGHLDALSPQGPLRRYRLIAVEHLLASPIVLDERILLFVLGVPAIDERVSQCMVGSPATIPLGEQQQRAADRLGRLLVDGGVLQLIGGDSTTRVAVAQAAAATQGMSLLRLRPSALAVSSIEFEAIVRRCERETLLAGVVPMIEVEPLDSPDVHAAARAFAEASEGLVVVSAPDSIPLSRRSHSQVEVPRATTAERTLHWEVALGEDATRIGIALARIAHQFRFEPDDITGIVAACDRHADDATLADELWQLSRVRARPRFDDLVRRIDPAACWDDLVVSPAVQSKLGEILHQLRDRHVVHGQWGFARGESRGQAITALFSGPSGTGKTLAAEVLAHEAKLDLYHVDLSQVVDKYVGETEKRLRRIFDAAEQGGAILLFDEADALFGKRGEVERGTDRWANLEVSYLLQRMEAYHGLAILTTNAKAALDHAFLRRLRFVIPFPFPDVQLRTQLWQKAFPPDAPTNGIEPAQLARLQLTGASIRNVALKAAFYAYRDGVPIEMQHVLIAARDEFAKLELPFPEVEARALVVAARDGGHLRGGSQ